MAKKIDESDSPFKRAAEEGLIGGENSNVNSSNKKRGRPLGVAGEWAPVFIGGICRGLSVKNAAALAGVHETMPYKRRMEDLEFRRAWNEAADVKTRLLEQEAARRAFHGTLKPVFHKGVECGLVREYSDTLMIFLLKARKPSKYREGVEDGGRGQVVFNLNIAVVDANGNRQDNQRLPEAAAVSPE